MAHNLFSKFPLGRSHIHFAHSFHLISPLFQRYCTSYLFFYVLQYFFDLFFQLLPVASKGKKSNIIISKCWGQFICIIIINMVEKYVWLIIHDNSSGRLEIETQGSFFFQREPFQSINFVIKTVAIVRLLFQSDFQYCCNSQMYVSVPLKILSSISHTTHVYPPT